MICDFRNAVVCGIALVAASLSGCGGDGMTVVSGTVTYDGQPIRKGTITFVSPDGEGPTAATLVVNGKYSLKVATGMKQVKIEGFKVTGQQPYSKFADAPMVDVQEQILPDRYNTKTELRRDIASRMRTCDFALEK